MGRLKTLSSRLAPAPSRLTTAAAAPGTQRLRGRAWMERRSRWLQLHPLCCDCDAEGRVTAGQEVDHVIPLWKGGPDDESNYATRCVEHHKVKTAREAAKRSSGAR